MARSGFCWVESHKWNEHVESQRKGCQQAIFKDDARQLLHEMIGEMALMTIFDPNEWRWPIQSQQRRRLALQDQLLFYFLLGVLRARGAGHSTEGGLGGQLQCFDLPESWPKEGELLIGGWKVEFWFNCWTKQENKIMAQTVMNHCSACETPSTLHSAW